MSNCKYTVFWFAGERDGEILYETDHYVQAMKKVYAFGKKYIDEFDPVCGGIGILDNERQECIDGRYKK